MEQRPHEAKHRELCPWSDHAGDAHFVKPEDRIAVFDNDGTLWSEQPVPFQFAFVIDRPMVAVHGRVLKDCEGLDRNCQASQIESSIHGHGFSTDA
jgi:hypothetical protein